MENRKLRLQRERLTELAIDDLRHVVGGEEQHTIDTNCCTCQTSLNSECGATTCIYSLPCAGTEKLLTGVIRTGN